VTKAGYDFEFPEKYHDSTTLNKDLGALCEQNPELIHQYPLGISPEGKEILGFIIHSDQQHLKGKPAALIIGCHHGRECITSEAALQSMKYLLEEYSQNNQIQAVIDKTVIIYIPMINPDGHDLVTRKNGHEVDLNRNYTFNWGKVPGCSHDKISQIYCGPTQLSELESQLINQMKIVDALFQKFKNIKSSLDMHSGAEVILYPWGWTKEPAPDDKLFKELCQKMEHKASKFGVLPFPSQTGMALYPTSGTYLDHVYKFYNCISFVAEIYRGRWAGNIWEFFNPPSNQYEQICRRTIPVILTVIEYAMMVS